eukprot:364640-Chlamydomonas_euryale.AAC.8
MPPKPPTTSPATSSRKGTAGTYAASAAPSVFHSGNHAASACVQYARRYSPRKFSESAISGSTTPRRRRHRPAARRVRAQRSRQCRLACRRRHCTLLPRPAARSAAGS